MAGRGDGIRVELRIRGRRRVFTVRLPNRSADAEEVPLLLALHGRGGSGQMMRQMTGFDAKADEWGFAVAYPDGYRRNWADGRRGDDVGTDGEEDVDFLRAVIDWSAQRHGTAADRTIVAGLSAGAFMGHRLAVQAGDQITALAAVASAMPGSLRELKPTHAVSVLMINGTADPIVPIEGIHRSRHTLRGQRRTFQLLSQQDAANYWCAANGCNDVTSTTHPAEPDRPGSFTTQQHRFTGGVADTTVSAWAVDGAGHTWPGSTPPKFHLIPIGPTAQNIDATEEICRFAIPRLHPAHKRQL
ncbi:PHB depolymerase family esterase [Nocardia sp. NPDC046763]|uniref:alpha/beta hydrolase family esterase n=1 Tax=Nocardia sp. NPDC046763 TaxID=3155256 RepID=UPI0033E4CEDA